MQAGDRYDFTGTLIVIPDVGALSLPGARMESGSHHKPGDLNTEGVRGLKALGVRMLNYRLAFLACSVTPTSPRVSANYSIHLWLLVKCVIHINHVQLTVFTCSFHFYYNNIVFHVFLVTLPCYFEVFPLHLFKGIGGLFFLLSNIK